MAITLNDDAEDVRLMQLVSGGDTLLPSRCWWSGISGS